MFVLAALVLSLAPWNGPALPTVTESAAKFRLAVHGEAGAQVQLRVVGLPAGWMAAFCTERFCSPLQYTMPLNIRGSGSVAVEAIRLDAHALKRIRLTIAAENKLASVEVTVK